MTDRPMIFSAPMIHALQRPVNPKTQTRRVAKPRGRYSLLEQVSEGVNLWSDSYILGPANADWLAKDAPAAAGDFLYVRENYRFGRQYDGVKAGMVSPNATVWYEADGTPQHNAGVLRPSIFLPKWASRIWLEVRDVRLERLQACTEEDAIAEGLQCWLEQTVYRGYEGSEWFDDPVLAYRDLWNHINGAGAWEANPLVWVISFQGVDP